MNFGEITFWSDDSLLVVNKPPGLHSLPDGWDPTAPHLRSVLEPAYGPLWIVHRLDRNTSGVIVLARSAEAHRALNRQFDKRQVSKTYHALALGSPPWEQETARLPLRVNVGHKHRTIVDLRKGKTSVTHFRVLQRFECQPAFSAGSVPSRMAGEADPDSRGAPILAFSLIEAVPETGRTHQIRAHLAALGFPIAADALYGGGEALSLPHIDSEERILINRMALHALSLDLSHPVTGERIHFEAPYPNDLLQTLDQLRNGCSQDTA